MDEQPNVATGEATASRKRTRTARPYPVHTLEEATAVASAIFETNAGLPLDRVLLAKSLGTTPASSGFTTKLNSSAKYGLTQGGYNDERIAVTRLGASVVAPKSSDERHQALVDAALEPEIFGRFYKLLDGKRVPEDAYAGNMLQRELDVPESLTDECLRILKANGAHVGVLVELGDHLYVTLTGEQEFSEVVAPEPPVQRPSKPVRRDVQKDGRKPDVEPDRPQPSDEASARSEADTRIFIGHVGDQDVVDYLKGVLDDFDVGYDVAEGDPADEAPVSADVSKTMRECDAAVLVFGKSGAGRDASATKMLYQLGAASLLFGDRIVSVREVGSDADGQAPSTPNGVEFQRDRLGDLGLALLKELHRTGVVSVQVRSA